MADAATSPSEAPGSGEWVPVAERLPNVNTSVLCMVEHCATKNRKKLVLVYVEEDDCSWRVDDFGGCLAKLSYDFNITHWMSLPEAPRQ
jgi:hypothetical protein